nr:hypothetical protein [Tanacetum cinerariifolium]
HAGEQRGEDDHLEGQVDPDGREADDGGDGVLQHEAQADNDGGQHAGHEQRGHRNLRRGRDAFKQAAADDHFVPRVGVEQPAGGGLQADNAGDERDHDYAHHHFRAGDAEGHAQDGGDGVLVGAVDDGVHVRHGEDQCQAREHGCGAADPNGHAHGAGDLFAGVRRLFGHVTAGFETVVQEHPGQRGSEEGGQVRAVDADVEGVEEHAERLMTFEDQQITAHQHSADQFAEKAEHGDARQHLGAAEVDDGGEQGQHQRDDDVGVGARFKTQHRGQIRTGTDRYGGDGHAQRNGVDPADHPRPALADQPARPRIDTPGNRELRNHFAEHQAHQHLADPHQQIGPEHRRSACRQAQA